jgi:hypothetical protein
VGDNERAVVVSKMIEEEYVRQGLREDNFRTSTGGTSNGDYYGAYYSTEWVKPVGNTLFMTLWVGNWVKDGTLFISIVPQPHCYDVSREFGEHMQSFMTNSLSGLQWNLVGKSEPDFDR